MTQAAVIEAASVPDAGAFLVRLLRLDAAALVRLRGGSLWARLPFDVLVTRGLRAATTVDATVRGSDLLVALDRLRVPPGDDTAVQPLRVLPARHDAAWRWPVPGQSGREIETLPAEAVLRISAAAAATVRAAESGGVSGRPIGSRVLRDALLDHVPIVVNVQNGEQIAVPQRLVQAMTRMDFVARAGDADGAADASVGVRVAGQWIGLAGTFGTAWYRPPGGPLSLRPLL
ncbi:MAG TPA: hypothetical protein VK453_07415 [Micromonosporaceae bacterium]|nr:hypothetical protein [Micromonosporaceae bacterium]